MKLFRSIIVAALLATPCALHAQDSLKVDYFKLKGYVQGGFNIDDDGENTFYLKRAVLTLSGDVFKKNESRADYQLMVNMAGSPSILEMWVRYSPVREFGMQLGQFKIPLTIENTDYSPTTIEMIEYSLPVEKLVRSGRDITGINTSGRDIGFKVFGSLFHRENHSILSYDLGLFNGNGTNRRDNDGRKDIIARLIISPIRYLKIAGYYQNGTVKADHIEGNIVTRYGGGISYDNNKLMCRSEYVGGYTGKFLSEGVYLTSGYWVTDKLMALGRADYFKLQRDLKDREMFYTLGLIYKPWKNLRLQLNYTLQEFTTPSDKSYSSLFNFMATALF
ncbi:MAG TPA: porin [Bacteroidales bacterium]|nr:porin [Bacteroidales bacterium]